MFVCMRVCVYVCDCVSVYNYSNEVLQVLQLMALGVTVHSMEVHGLSNKVCYECNACHRRQGWRCISHSFHKDQGGISPLQLHLEDA